MPKTWLSGVVLSGLLLNMVGCSNADPDVLTISAKVEFEVMPDAAVINVELGEQATSREGVLKQMVAKHKALKEGLSEYEGVESIKFEADAVSISPVPTQDCARSLLGKMGEYSDLDDIYDAYELCPEADFYASMDLEVTVTPPSAAGIVLSYATLSEVKTANLDGFIVMDMQKAKQNAKSAAAGKIRSIAQDIGSQSGVTIGRIKKLSFKGDSHFGGIDRYSDDEIVVTATRRIHVSEDVRLDVDLELITIAETVTATFVISE